MALRHTHASYLIHHNVDVALVLYSPLLSSQIPVSRAANAFNVCQRGLHQFELVRLCALWDRVEPEKEDVLWIEFNPERAFLEGKKDHRLLRCVLW
jgi:hypothetical protein